MDCYLDPFHQKVSDLTPRCASTQGFKALIIFSMHCRFPAIKSRNYPICICEGANFIIENSLIQFWPSPYGVPTYLYGTLPGNMGSIPGHINCQQLNNPILTFSHSASLVKSKSALYVPEGPIKRFFFSVSVQSKHFINAETVTYKLIICIINVKLPGPSSSWSNFRFKHQSHWFWWPLNGSAYISYLTSVACLLSSDICRHVRKLTLSIS